jgi:hypothetical protein
MLVSARPKTAWGGLAAALAILCVSPAVAQDVDVWSRPVQAERSRSCDFIHYRVSLTFDLDGKAFWGENRATMTPLFSGVDRCEVDAEDLTVEGAFDLAGEALFLERSDTSIVVVFPEPLSFGDTVEFTLEYRGEGSRDGFFFDDQAADHPQMVSTDSWPDEAHQRTPGRTRPTNGSPCTTTPTTR